MVVPDTSEAKSHAIITYTVDDDAKIVWILGIYYGGHHYAVELKAD